MKMMMGLTKVSSGKIKYSGKDIEEKTVDKQNNTNGNGVIWN